MSDPLRAAASVVGLLTAAAQISKILANVIDKARHAPKECTRIKAEVDDIRNVLASLQMFITGANRASRSRTSLILVDQVVVTLAVCVTTFSELDAFATSLDCEADMNILDRLRWVGKDSTVKAILARLESHKSSLALMLTILTCQSQDEAENKVDRLCDLVEKSLEQNTILKQRLEAAEVRNDEPRDTSRTLVQSYRSQDSITDETLRQFEPEDRDEPPKLQGHVWRFAFEDLLMNSRPYRLTTGDNTDCFSIITSAGRTASWSMLSGLSLSEISHIGIQAIPIYASDITNKDCYDFSFRTSGAMLGLSEQKPLVTSSTKQRTPRRDWLKNFLRGGPAAEADPKVDIIENTQVVFGVPLTQSIIYAGAQMGFSFNDSRYRFNSLPIIVARTLYILSTTLTETFPGFCARNGNPVRMSRLQRIFDTAPDYGIVGPWDEYTVHDTMGVLLRYLKSLPEPVIPYKNYDKFIENMAPFVNLDPESDEAREDAHRAALEVILNLPEVNREVLVCILQSAVLFCYTVRRVITAERLISAFQPSILSGPPETMKDEDHQRTVKIVVLLVGILSIDKEEGILRAVLGAPQLVEQEAAC